MITIEECLAIYVLGFQIGFGLHTEKEAKEDFGIKHKYSDEERKLAEWMIAELNERRKQPK